MKPFSAAGTLRARMAATLFAAMAHTAPLSY